MSDAIATGILSAGAAITAASLTAWFGFLKQGSEEQRWYADHYLPEKLRVLRELHKTMVVTHYRLNVDLARSHVKGISVGEFFSRVDAMQDEYLNAMAIAKIYVAADVYLAFERVLGSVRTITAAIFNSASANDYAAPRSVMAQTWPMGRDEQKEYDESFRAAQLLLGDLLHPRKVLDDIHSRGKG